MKHSPDSPAAPALVPYHAPVAMTKTSDVAGRVTVFVPQLVAEVGVEQMPASPVELVALSSAAVSPPRAAALSAFVADVALPAVAAVAALSALSALPALVA